MDEKIKTIIVAVCAIITVGSGLVIAYLNKKKRELEEERDRYREEKHIAQKPGSSKEYL